MVTLLLAFTAGNNGTISQAQSQEIDPRITGEERKIMEWLLPLLPPDARENVVHVAADGNIYLNRLELRKEVKVTRQIADRTLQTSDGEIIILPEDDEPGVTVSAPRCAGNSGPYRRVHSKPGGGGPLCYTCYGALSAIVRLASKYLGDIRLDPTTETAYVYSGGWGRTDGNISGVIDAGFQHNYGNDNWSVFLKRTMPNRKTFIAVGRFIGDQFAGLRFWIFTNPDIPGSTFAAVRGEGELQNGRWDSRTVTADTTGGWRADGVGNILKRVTSIAKNPRTGAALLTI